MNRPKELRTISKSAPSEQSVNQWQRWKDFLSQKVHRVAEFFVSQGITMAGNLLYGFLCVRLLPIPEFAKYAVVFGFLGTITVLMDIGFSSTLLPLVGARTNDRQLIADYVASLRQLAHWLYLMVAPALVVAYPLVVRKQQWNWRIVAAMVVILLTASWFARVGGAYGAVLIVRRDRPVWYRVQMISSLGTLALLCAFWAFHWLNAFSAILLNVVGIIFVAAAYFFRARRLLGVKGYPSKEHRREIIHLASPSMPNTIFYAFQGSISIFLITFFGRATAVAGLGALTRLSQIFTLFAQMNPLLIEPYFASLPKARLKRNYVGVVFLESVFSVVVTALAAYFPGLFLWILGPKYSNLRFEVFIMIAVAAVGHLSGVLWIVHSARKFVYWWNGAAVIVSSVLIEALFIWKFDLSNVKGVLEMNVVLVFGGLAIHISTGVVGFIRGPREMKGAMASSDGGAYEPAGQ